MPTSAFTNLVTFESRSERIMISSSERSGLARLAPPAQQVMAARAMLQSKDWLMLDEPTAFLDIRGQRHLWEMLTTHLNRGGSVMLATHDLRGMHRWMHEAPADVTALSSIHQLSTQGLSPLATDATLHALEAALG